MATGPSGWTRTTTTRVKSPACCVDTTEGSGANDGIRTRTSRLGRPVGNRYPTFALDRPTGIEPVPPRWQRGMLPPHPGRTWTGVAHRPIDIRQFSKTPLLRAGGRQGIRTQSLPWGRTGLRPVSGPSARTALWRQRQDSNPDPQALEARMLPLHHAALVTHVPIVLKTQPPSRLARVFFTGLRPKQKRPSRGSP